MKLYYIIEGRFVRKNGNVYSLGGFEKKIWDRYLKHFDKICVIARVANDYDKELTDDMISSTENVEFIDLPYYVGFSEYIKNVFKIKEKLKQTIVNDGVYLCRLPSVIAKDVIKILNARDIPYFCEVVGDPWDVFSKGSINHPLRGLIRISLAYNLKKELRKCMGALYVTQFKLQRRYPVKKNVFSIGVSDVIIPDENIPLTHKIFVKKDIYKLVSVGSLDQLYKAPDIVLQSIKLLYERGFICNLTWLGDGKFKEQLLSMAKEIGIAEYVDFKGLVSREEVNSTLMDSDIFILVSRTEGLPRALVEAMSYGLPCIGSCVGGIPELLEDSVLVNKNDPIQLANVLVKMITDTDFTNNQAKRNLDFTKEFSETTLNKKRNTFFEHIKDVASKG